MRKPRAKRYRKRLRLHFGKEEPQHPGVTGNISTGGISIHSAVPVPKGVRIVMRIQLPGEPDFLLYGMVRWARRVQLQIGMAPQSRMGIQFDELPHQQYLDLMARIEIEQGDAAGATEIPTGLPDDDDTAGIADEATIDETVQAIVDRAPSAADLNEARASGQAMPNVQARRAPLVSSTNLPSGPPPGVSAPSGHRLERMPETLPPGIVKSMGGKADAAEPAPADPGFPVPPVGTTARMTTVVDEQHLAFPESGSSPLAPTAAIDMFMQVAGKLLGGTAPSTSRLLMHRCSLAVSHTLPVSEGSALVTTVKLMQLDVPKRQLHLEAMIFDEEMQVGLGKYVVMLLPPE